MFSYIFGPPWGKWTTKDRFTEYLEAKYEKDYVVEDVSYDFFHSCTYNAYAHATDEPEIIFHVGEMRGSGQIDDAYHYEAVRYHAKKEITPIVEKYFSKDSRYSIETSPISEAGDPVDYIYQSSIEIGVSLEDVTISKHNENQEVEEAAGLLFELKEMGIEFRHFGISYQNRTLQLTPDLIYSIENKEDLSKQLVPYKR
ncbi:hypothetical protein [Bacillus sp. AK031]